MLFSFKVSTLAASILAIYVASLRSLLTVSLSPLPEALSSYKTYIHLPTSVHIDSCSMDPLTSSANSYTH